jgi:TRAP-type C4-dicarboxylate transport system permease small subunit
VSSKSSDGGAWLDRALGAAAAVLLLGLVAITTADVIGRYIFNWPLRMPSRDHRACCWR